MKGDKLEVGDYVIPTVPGIMELGDPPYKITEVDGNMYTVVQTMGTHNHTMKLPTGRLRKV
jgi:hypothetical protein